MIKNYRIGIVLFFIITLIYLSNLPANYIKDLNRSDHRNLMPASDVIPNTFLPYLLIKNQTFVFDSISFYLRSFDDNAKNQYYLLERNNHKYSVYPPLTGIAALPVYLIPVLLNKIPHFQYSENLLKTLALGRITASLYTALSCVFIYFIFKHFSKDKFYPILFTIFFALGTNNWSISSRGMWQHTITVFLLSALILLIVKKRNLIWIGLLLGLLIITRPTNAIISLLIFTFLVYKKENYKMLIIGILPSVLFYLVYNNFVFGSPIAEGYGARNDLNWSTPLLTGLSGFLFSPARSFLFISPPLILTFYGIYKLFKDSKFGGEYNLFLRYLSLIFIFSMIVFAKWYTWNGANGFGYRMLTDYLPIVTLISFLVFIQLKNKLKVLVGLLIVYSILIQFNAVFYKRSRCSAENDWNFNCLLPVVNENSSN